MEPKEFENWLDEVNAKNERKPDFIATLKYLTYQQGGRRGPAYSGYRPGIEFPFDKMQTSGQQTFIGKDIVYPGDIADAEIIILSVDYFAGKLHEGMTFEFKEGPTLIGTGIIQKIINEKLKSNTL